MKRTVLSVMGILLLFGFPLTLSHAATVDVTVQDFSFTPSALTVSVGDSVRWTSLGGSHAAVSGANCTADGRWNSGVLEAGQDFTVTFDEPGTYSYFSPSGCTGGMTGTVTVTSPTTSLLSVERAGTGSAEVSSAPAGILCGTDCSESYPTGTRVTLTASPQPGTSFTGWSGACKDTNPVCVVHLTSDKDATAHFITEGDAAFDDVPQGYWADDYINALYNNGLTTGCGSGNYCPEELVTRGQMAAFLVRARYGENFNYFTTPYFSDVEPSNDFFRYIQKLKEDGITKVEDVYGVADTVTRSQMAAFLIRTKYGDTFTYSTAPYFSDVPADHPYFSYIQKLKDDGTTSVSGAYGADDLVTRSQMAAFMSRAFLGMQ
ncbi:MAG: S-layer homology domain-containing protein [Thermodesulfovibrionales bacterium]